MDSLTSKAAYLKGLCEGLKLDTEKAEGQLISKIIETLGDIAEAVDDVCDAHDELEGFVRDMDDDLAELEELAYDEDEDEDEDDLSDYEDGDDDDDMGFFEIQCPNCHEDVMVNFDTLDDEAPIVCPNCHQEIELEFDCDCDDCDHDCGHEDE